MIDKKQQPLILTNRGRLVIFVAGTMTLLFCLYSNMTAKWPGILLLSLGSPCLILKAKVLVAQLCPILVILVTLWSVAHQASLSMEFSRQESWSGLPFRTIQAIVPTLGSNIHRLLHRRILMPVMYP